MSGIEGKIRTWLDKQGYPFEMRVAKAFEKSGFYIEVSKYYKDLDENKHREIDVVATNSVMVNENHRVMLNIIFTCECKNSSDKPWLLLSSDSHEKKFDGDATSFRHANHYGHVALLALSVEGVAKTNRLLMHRENLGFSLVRAFGEQSDMAYKAIMSASRAAKGMAKYSDEYYNKLRVFSMDIYFPVVVITGRLFKCTLGASDSIELSEINQGALICTNPDSGEINSTIEIVTESGLPVYLQERVAWIDKLFERLSLGVESLDTFLNSPGAGINEANTSN